MIFRKAVASDLDDIEKGYQEHFAFEKEHGAFTVFREGVYPTRADAETALQNGALYVSEENNILLGSIILDEQQPDEYKKIDWPSKAPKEKVKVIHLLMVRPGFAGKGVGSALADYALGIAKERSCAVVRLDTGEQNIPAVSLYKKLGFHLVAASPMRVGGVISHNHHLFFEKVL